jgi:hypothetical protein
MISRSFIRAAVACLAQGISACGSPPEVTYQRFEATLRVVSDDAEPLGGAKFSLGKQALGTTSSAGTLAVRLRGTEGQMLPLALDCPEGYAGPATVPSLRLTRTRRVDGRTTEPLSLEAVCARKTRDVTVVVHATNGHALPVLINGTEHVTTDADGNAHLLLRIDRGERTFTVKLDTTARPELKPAKPERTLELSGRDAIVLFEPSFVVTPSKRPARPTPAPTRRHVPYRID